MVFEILTQEETWPQSKRARMTVTLHSNEYMLLFRLLYTEVF